MYKTQVGDYPARGGSQRKAGVPETVKAQLRTDKGAFVRRKVRLAEGDAGFPSKCGGWNLH